MSTEKKPDCFGEYPMNAMMRAERCCEDCPFEGECYDGFYHGFRKENQ